MKKRIVALFFAFVLLLSVGAQAIYYPNGERPTEWEELHRFFISGGTGTG